ncbi:MAG: hypothetical protein HY236_03440 [Acidobacteria bacterium]|nr:hypothetical protein [Acidobacteriota bacterium]
MTTYSFPGNGAPAILPAFLNSSRSSGTVIAYGPGLSSNLPNVSVSVMGSGVRVHPGSPSPYAPAVAYTEIDLDFGPLTGTGPRHLVFSLNGDVYVRTDGLQLVSQDAPLVRSVQPQTDSDGNLELALAGDNFAADSRVFLDGAPAPVLSFDKVAGVLGVSPPPGPAGRPAVISVYNPDGQSSVFVQPDAPITYTYPSAGAPSLRLAPSSGRAGRDVTVDIQGTNTNFVNGQTTVGFGTPDIVTRRVWVLDPTHLLAVASISPSAAQTSTTVSVTSGAQLTALNTAFQVLPPASSNTTPLLSFQGLVNAASSQPRIAPGSIASLYGLNLSLASPAAAGLPLPTTLAGSTVTLNDRPVPLLVVTPTQINLQIPFEMPVGPAILQVSNGTELSDPMAVQIDAFAPGLFRVFNSAGASLDKDHPAVLGDTLVLYGTGLGPVDPQPASGVAASAAATTAPVKAHVAGVDLDPAYAGLAPGFVGLYQVNVPLPANLQPAASTQIFLRVQGQNSNALPLALRAPSI